MFINGLYLITALATQCPEAITEVGDDYIIIDTRVCKDIIEKIQDPFAGLKATDSKAVYLPPPENEAETHEYPYVKAVKPSVHIARAHVKQDFKSSEILSFNYFYGFLYRRVLRGESSFCMYLKHGAISSVVERQELICACASMVRIHHGIQQQKVSRFIPSSLKTGYSK